MHNIEQYNKLDDFTFPILNFSFFRSNISAALVYGVYILRLIRYALVVRQLTNRAQLRTKNLIKQDYVALILGWSHRYKTSTVVITFCWPLSKCPVLKFQWIFPLLRSLFFLQLSSTRLLLDLIISNTMNVVYKAETAYHWEASGLIPGF